ncbi:MAG: dual specificity protein phosphatase family protein [Acidobacteria bacterium]|nr:dual specificity protein phosphatase family protein [Acidobacteriota bacterium]
MIEGFSWILPDALAGSAKPGLMGNLEEDLDWLKEQEIRTLFNLTEKPLPVAADEDLAVQHFPIPDMGIVPPRRMVEVCTAILTKIRQGERVLIHCRAGLGRTGTVGACTLVSLGVPPDGAIRLIRSRSPYSIQTQSQESLIHHYAEHLVSLEGSGELPPFFAPPNTASVHALPDPRSTPPRVEAGAV